MTMRATGLTILAAGIALAGTPLPADAQIGDRLRDRARQQAERQVERAVESDETVSGEAAGEIGEAPTGAALGIGQGGWATFDFVPGEQVILAEDFSGDRVGEFPRRFELRRGNVEVVERNGQRFLRATSDSEIELILPRTLPDHFTLEFDHMLEAGWRNRVRFADDHQSTHMALHYARAGLTGGGVNSQTNTPPGIRQRLATVRLMASGSEAKMYINEARVANVPNARLGRSDRIYFTLRASPQQPTLISNIRIATGGRSLYDALSADGRVVTRGIRFDTGSDRLRPESTPVLREIGDMLRRHGDLRLRVEGHTDATGSDDVNQRLSAQRAQAVRRYLIEEYGVAADRLEAAGLGSSRPIDSNDTPEGRQNNRRVELARL